MQGKLASTSVRTAMTVIAVAGCVLMLQVPIASFLHSIVPHTHHHAGEQHAELASWLHTTLTRKEYSFDAAFIPLLFWSSLFFVVLFISTLFKPAYVRAYIPHIQELRRGILPYRTFW